MNDKELHEKAERFANEIFPSLTDHKIKGSIVTAIAFALRRAEEERVPSKAEIKAHTESTKKLLESGDYPDVALKLKAISKAMEGKFFEEGYQKGLKERDPLEAGLVRLEEYARIGIYKKESGPYVVQSIDEDGWGNTFVKEGDSIREAVEKALEEMDDES